MKENSALPSGEINGIGVVHELDQEAGLTDSPRGDP
jgi:hypothetical protein